LTGVGQIAAGIGVLFSIYPRIAATAEAGMLSLFTLLVWGPAILAAPTTRLPWTAFFISWAIAAGAWVVADNVPKKSSREADARSRLGEGASSFGADAATSTLA
jgi:hypothetical protein